MNFNFTVPKKTRHLPEDKVPFLYKKVSIKESYSCYTVMFTKLLNVFAAEADLAVSSGLFLRRHVNLFAAFFIPRGRKQCRFRKSYFRLLKQNFV